MTDHELVEALRQQNEQALNWFHRHYRDRIFAVARRIVRDDSDAEEVVQDVVWTVFRKIHLFNGTSAFWSWCYRVTENCAKMKVRKYKRYPTPVDSEILQVISQSSTPDNPNDRPDQQYAYRRTLEQIEAFLQETDEMNRAVYIAMDIDGLSKEEVAEQLDLTIPALKARLHRVRYALRERLGQPA
jgi:RNA polymerase sigma-70 factor (ECF subfamily)